ncbi:MAG: tetratricopeptide repeat protein [Myxococcales bacterium]|nr:tetratricopeptide repeat protein [Myxococcales bacterium]
MTAFPPPARRRITVAAVIVLVLLAASLASGKDDLRVRAQEHIDRGDQLFETRKFEEAIAEYTAALALESHHDLIWNIARSHEELGRLKDAIALFERYLGMDPPEADRALASARLATLRTRLQTETRGRLVVNTADGADIAVGGVVLGKGPRLEKELSPGRYRISVTFASGATREETLRIPPGGEAVLDLLPSPGDATPATPPPAPVYTDWSGRFVVLAISPQAAPYDRAVITLDAAGVGRLERPSEKPLEAWRSPHCRGDKALRWTLLHDVAFTGGDAASLVLSGGRFEGCSCDPFCRVADRFETPMLRVPAFDGAVGEELILVRAQPKLPESPRRPLEDADLMGTWRPIVWPAAPGNDTQLALDADGAGSLVTRRQGELLSWQRRGCAGATSWTQTATWDVRWSRRNGSISLLFTGGRELDCSCAKACTVPPALADLALTTPAIPRTLAGRGSLFSRVLSAEPSATGVASPVEKSPGGR